MQTDLCYLIGHIDYKLELGVHCPSFVKVLIFKQEGHHHEGTAPNSHYQVEYLYAAAI